MLEVIPGICEKEINEIERKIHLFTPHIEWIHLDIADGTLVSTETCLQFTQLAPLVKLDGEKKLSFEAHLMVASPEKYIRSLVDTGFRRLIAHVESHDPRLFLDQIKYESAEAGIALDGSTELEQIEPYLEEIDVALVMVNEIGGSEPAFLPETLEKIKLIRQQYPDLPIEAEGGIDDQNVKIVKEAGATRLVATNYIFKDPERIAHIIETLKKA